jgi:UDP-N-acetylglucosamine 2-epimerase (non-hydrolysing)
MTLNASMLGVCSVRSEPESRADNSAARVLAIVGTRPEAIKLAPVVSELERAVWANPAVLTTGQHGSVVAETLLLLETKPDYELMLERSGDLISELNARLLLGIAETIERVGPDLVVVQGDTASALAGAQAAFFAGIPVAHVEAGLRSGDLAAPFPEEGNRRLIGQIAALHLAPTAGAAENLRAEGVCAERIVVTGNTVIDAIRAVGTKRLDYGDPDLEFIDARPGPVVVVTAHRRESWGEPMRRIGRAVADIAEMHSSVSIVVAAHMNPAVRTVLEAELAGRGNVYLPGPIAYGAFVRLLARAGVVITDSGGIQEECAALSVPTLVTRDVTERGEGVDAGIATLVGTDGPRIVAECTRLLAGPPSAISALNPYGDGNAAARVVAACGWLLGHGEKLAEFRPGVVV